MTGPPGPRLTIEGLCKRYGTVEALAGLSLSLAPGEILGLLGPNGAGKTTTVESIAGLVEPDDGSILLDNAPLDHKARRRIGIALQASALQDAITVREALALFAQLYDSATAIDALLDRFGLTEQANTRFAALSGGRKQRLALAIALVNDPVLLLLDEPTAGLDLAARRDLHALIRSLAADGCAVLLTTHDMAEAEQLCDRVAVIDRGRVIAEGAPDALIGSTAPATLIEGEASQPLDPAVFAALEGLEAYGARFRWQSHAPRRDTARLLALLETHGIDLVSLRVGHATLEDFIAALTVGSGTR